MHRPTERHEDLRQRVVAGRERQSAKQRRAAVARTGGRRAIAIGAGLAMVAGVLTVTQLASSALEDNEAGWGENAACEETSVTVEEVEADEDLELHVEEGADGTRHYHYRKKPDSGWSDPEPPPLPPECQEDEGEDNGGSGGEGEGTGGEGTGGEGTGGEGTGGEGEGEDTGGEGEGEGNGGDNLAGIVPPGGADGNNNGLEILGRDCSNSDLPLHTGFQTEEAVCIDAAHGEQTAVENNPTLLITDAPVWVQTDEAFTISVSTRNLLRDRFLGAGDGGYYLESSFLDENGIQRGHFHVGCTELREGNVAPDPLTLLEPEFFAAVEDSGGGAGVSEVTIDVPGLSTPGMYRCMAWAGDPSHRVPMMGFARQHIAVDAVRISVTEDGQAQVEQ